MSGIATKPYVTPVSDNNKSQSILKYIQQSLLSSNIIAQSPTPVTVTITKKSVLERVAEFHTRYSLKAIKIQQVQTVSYFHITQTASDNSTERYSRYELPCLDILLPPTLLFMALYNKCHQVLLYSVVEVYTFYVLLLRVRGSYFELTLCSITETGRVLTILLKLTRIHPDNN